MEQLLTKLRALVAKLERLDPEEKLDCYAVSNTGDILTLEAADEGLECSILAGENSYSSTPLGTDYDTVDAYDEAKTYALESGEGECIETHLVFVARSAPR